MNFSRILKVSLLALTLLFCTHTINRVFSSVIKIAGKVTNSKKIPLQGAIIGFKQKKISTKTNSLGKFLVYAQLSDSLVIEYIGYEPRVIPVAKFSNHAEIVLTESNSSFNDVPVK